MFGRRLYVMLAALLLVTTCSPGGQTSSDDALRQELAPIVRAILKGNVADRLAVLEYMSTPCATVDGLGGPPRCAEGVAEGTIVDVLPVLGPEGIQATAGDMQEIMNDLQVKSLYAVYRVTPGPVADPLYPTGDHAMLFDRDLNDLPMPLVLQVRDGKVIRMDFPAAAMASDMLKEIPAEQIVITPSEAQAWSGEIRQVP